MNRDIIIHDVDDIPAWAGYAVTFTTTAVAARAAVLTPGASASATAIVPSGVSAVTAAPSPLVSGSAPILLNMFNVGVATDPSITMANVVSRLGQYPNSDRLYCGLGERPSQHTSYVNGTLYPNGVVPVLSIKDTPDAQVIADIRAMSGPGILIIHHEPFPTDAALTFGPNAPEPDVWADMQVNGNNVIIPAINAGRAPQDQWKMGAAFHGFAFTYDPATDKLTYAAKFKNLGGYQAYRLIEVFNLPGYIPGVDAYDSGTPANNPDGGVQGPAQRMESFSQFLIKVCGIPRASQKIEFPEFGTYADGNYQEACDWLMTWRHLVVAACSWDHAENDQSLVGAKLASYQPLLDVQSS